MILPDANLLLYAYDSTSPFHAKARAWWEQCLSGAEPVILCPPVVFAFVRIGTHPRAFDNPMPIAVASGHVADWLRRNVCRLASIERADVDRALTLLESAGTGGDLTSDAQIAALAIRLGATVHSADTDFLRFPALKVVNPLLA
jgi:hypothetical protein